MRYATRWAQFRSRDAGVDTPDGGGAGSRRGTRLFRNLFLRIQPHHDLQVAHCGLRSGQRVELVKQSIEEVARKVNRTPKAIRNMLRRNHLSLREIRCDLFSVESLASALRVQKRKSSSGLNRDGSRRPSPAVASGDPTPSRPKR